MTAAAAPRRFTGWHMTAIMVAFFGVVIVVNVMMARAASSSFTGTVVDNGYVASQSFNRWLDAAAKDRALGWSASARRLPDNRIAVTMAGTPAAARVAEAHAVQPLDGKADRELAFVRADDGSFVSTAPLPAGRWRLLVRIDGQGHAWHGEVPLP